MQSTLSLFPNLQAPIPSDRQASLAGNRTIRMTISVLFGMLLITAAAFAQVESGQVSGTVTDQSGAIVPNATITVKNLGTSAQRTTQTSPAGSYVVTGLAPGVKWRPRWVWKSALQQASGASYSQFEFVVRGFLPPVNLAGKA